MGKHVPESMTEECFIDWAERLTNSASGNPRWKIGLKFSGISSVVFTAPDADCNYGVSNYIGKTAMVTINRHGRIIHIRGTENA